MAINVSGLRLALQPIKTRIKSTTSKSFWLRYCTLAGYRMFCSGLIHLTGKTLSGSYTVSAAEAVQHAQDVFALFKSVSGIKRFQGKVADVGPGESCALGLLFLADGCSQVDLPDRFSFPDSQLQRDVNQAVVAAHPSLRTRMADKTFAESSFAGLRRYSGENAAAEKFFAANHGYDYIVSVATLEHVYDPLSALTHMARALNPDGVMIHNIDFRDHGQFSESFHDLKFLELSDAMYAPLRWQGGPNRVRLSAYLDHLETLGFTVETFAQYVTGIKDAIPSSRMDLLPNDVRATAMQAIERARPSLAARFVDSTDDDLIAANIVLAARRS
ncbi:MAG TPA: methyltransferase domain-containing protein [Candidatus Angelobacter sp.]|jgi:SAM-dependent methyltransferase|nr:methyltransferase domain-containing protein [Candidatus Angelobacter sp.]